MCEKTVTKTDYNYLSQKPGVLLIKAGTYKKIELNNVLGIPAVKSQIIDVPVTSKENALQLDTFPCSPEKNLNLRTHS